MRWTWPTRTHREAVLIICDGRTFIAGADISEFGKPLKDPWLPAVVNRIESTAKPVVAAIHGTALGGGFEVACRRTTVAQWPRHGSACPKSNSGCCPGQGVPRERRGSRASRRRWT